MEIVKESFLKAVAVALLLIGIGAFIGLQADNARQGFLEEQLRESNLRSETFVVTQNYLEDSSQNYCKVVRGQIPQLADENAQIGQDLQSFKSKSLSSERSYEFIRKKYYANQLKLFNMLQSYENRCQTNMSTVTFFFDDSIDSQRQGSVLTRYRKEIDNRAYVFSYNLETDGSTVLEILKTDYNVTEGPTMVLNGDKKLEGFVSLGELREELK